MVLVLCIGDFHIPHRATDLPPRFKELLQPGKIQHILCTGNLCCRDLMEYLRGVCGSVYVTKGDFDSINVPEDNVITIEEFKIGLCHGHQVVPAGDVEALGILMRRLNVDILVTGHTHISKIEQMDGRLLINPGSATGAYSLYTKEVIPTFILMDIVGRKADVYIYQMIDGESKVKKMEFVKPDALEGVMEGPKGKFQSTVDKIIEGGGGVTKEDPHESSNGNPPSHEEAQ
eukprot:g5381.t1